MGLVLSLFCRAARFKGFQQQDSQELLRYLLDGMRAEEIKVCSQFQTNLSVYHSGERFPLKIDTVAVEVTMCYNAVHYIGSKMVLHCILFL